MASPETCPPPPGAGTPGNPGPAGTNDSTNSGTMTLTIGLSPMPLPMLSKANEIEYSVPRTNTGQSLASKVAHQVETIGTVTLTFCVVVPPNPIGR